MISSVSRQILRIAQPMGARCMSGGLKGFNEAEAAKEAIYFNKEDQRVMMKLLNKVKAQSDVADRHAAAGITAAEHSAIKDLVKKYKMSSDDVEFLLKWKHTHY